MINDILKKVTVIGLSTSMVMVSLSSGFAVFAEGKDSFKVSGKITGFTGIDDNLLPVTVVSLTPAHSKTPVCITTGVDEYRLEGVETGEYTLTVAARGEYVTHEYDLTVCSDETFDIEIYELGDVNHDGRISEEDCDFCAVKDPYDVLLADVNYDGIVDEADAELIGQLVNGEIESFPCRPVLITEECQKAIDEKLTVDDAHVLDGRELIVTMDEEVPLAYFLANHAVSDFEVFIGDNEWGVRPFIGLTFEEGYTIEEEASFMSENDHVVYMHPSYFAELIEPSEVRPVDYSSNEDLLLENLELTDDTFALNQYDYYEDMEIWGAWNIVNDNKVRKAKIAVIDCDLNYYHPDLVNVIDPDKCFNAMDYECLDVWSVDGPYRDNFTLNPYDPENMMSNHGTGVISAICAEANNGIGIAGAASVGTNDAVEVYFYNCSSYSPYTGGVIPDINAVYRSILCAISEGVDVINMSFRIIFPSDDQGNYTNFNNLIQSAYDQGITIIAAGGNEGSVDNEHSSYHDNSNGQNYSVYPSDWDQCIAAAGLWRSTDTGMDPYRIQDSKYRRAVYSSYNSSKDIAAFSTDIYIALSNDVDQFEYALAEGTSFSAPVITSVAAMMKAVNPSLTNDQIYNILTKTATDISYHDNTVNEVTNAWGEETAGTGYDIYTGYGMVNAERCVEKALELRDNNRIFGVYPNYVSLPTNSTYQLSWYSVPLSNHIIWSSSDSSVASVNQSGQITAHKYGSVTINATASVSGSITDSIIVQTRYYDVNDMSKYYFNPVYWAADHAITRGYNDVYFGPSETCDRKSVAIFLWRLSGRPEAEGTVSFTDVNYQPSTDTYKAILWASVNGIVNGYSDGTFRPNNPITRKDAAIMLYRLNGRPQISGEMPFQDVIDLNYPESSDTYKSILWASRCGITHGYTDGTFRPLDNCIRADIVTFLYRYASLN